MRGATLKLESRQLITMNRIRAVRQPQQPLPLRKPWTTRNVRNRCGYQIDKNAYAGVHRRKGSRDVSPRMKLSGTMTEETLEP
jgi:hypothetical protein